MSPLVPVSIHAKLIPIDSPPCVLDTGSPCRYDDACRFVPKSKARHSGRDCRNPVAMEGNAPVALCLFRCHLLPGVSPPCVLDTGIPCRYDGGSSFRPGGRNPVQWTVTCQLHKCLIYAICQPVDSPPCVLDTGNPCRYDDACRFVPKSKARHSGRDCRNLGAMEGNAAACTSVHSCHPIPVDSPPCVLDTGNPCRYDGFSCSHPMSCWLWVRNLSKQKVTS